MVSCKGICAESLNIALLMIKEVETMRPGKLENLVSSGFCFLRECGENAAIYENKFTGLWLEFHFDNNTYRIMED